MKIQIISFTFLKVVDLKSNCKGIYEIDDILAKNIEKRINMTDEEVA